MHFALVTWLGVWNQRAAPMLDRAALHPPRVDDRAVAEIDQFHAGIRPPHEEPAAQAGGGFPAGRVVADHTHPVQPLPVGRQRSGGKVRHAGVLPGMVMDTRAEQEHRVLEREGVTVRRGGEDDAMSREQHPQFLRPETRDHLPAGAREGPPIVGKRRQGAVHRLSRRARRDIKRWIVNVPDRQLAHGGTPGVHRASRRHRADEPVVTRGTVPVARLPEQLAGACRHSLLTCLRGYRCGPTWSLYALR